MPALLAMTIWSSGCLGQENNHVTVSPLSKNVNIQADDNDGAFDVNALASVVQNCTDPATLERKINTPANDINNLDLDNDGNIDYLAVKETGQNQLEIYDEAVNPAVLVANLSMTPENGNVVSNNNMATLQINGTPDYCGPYYYYHRPHISFGTMLFMAYLLRPHSYYTPMWGYGHYPGYYVSHRTVVRTSYRPSRSTYTPRQRNYSHRSSLSNPSSSHRSFNARTSNKPVRSGGFGNNRTSSAGSTSHSSRSGFGNRSSAGSSRSSSSTYSNHSNTRSGFGSSRARSSGFGSSSRSSGSSGFGRSSSRSSGSSRSSFSSHSSGRSFGRRR